MAGTSLWEGEPGAGATLDVGFRGLLDAIRFRSALVITSSAGGGEPSSGTGRNVATGALLVLAVASLLWVCAGRPLDPLPWWRRPWC